MEIVTSPPKGFWHDNGTYVIWCVDPLPVAISTMPLSSATTPLATDIIDFPSTATRKQREKPEGKQLNDLSDGHLEKIMSDVSLVLGAEKHRQDEILSIIPF